MKGTSTAKALWEAACKCVPADTQVWTLENTNGVVNPDGTADIAATGGLPLICCATPNNATGATGPECTPQTFQTFLPSGALPSANAPYVCGDIDCTGCPVGTTTSVAIVNCPSVAFSNFNCKKRCWSDQTMANIPTLVTRPCRIFLTAGGWTSRAVAVGTPALTPPATPACPVIIPGTADQAAPKVEILKALDAIIDCFVSCNTLCNSAGDIPALIPDTLVDTSILVYAFNQGSFCDNYFDSNGNPINSAAQFLRAILGGRDLIFNCAPPINTGACGCLCANESAITVNLCDYPCLASRLLCTEKLKNILQRYTNCRRPRKSCDLCAYGTL